MGNWNRRYMPRPKKSRHSSEYEETPLSPNRSLYTSGAKDNRLPYWEIDYCKSVKVPWNKILASKKYIICYPSVLNWDASAGEEALKNAKQRYLAMINGIPCDNPLPDPDMYIGEIDWNPYMDPELMAELDHYRFDPDKAQEDEKLEMANEEAKCSQAQNNQTNIVNPWEGNHEQYSGTLKEALHGWSRWDDSVNLEEEKRCEQSGYQHDFSGNDAWKIGNESSGWSQRPFGCDNSWTNSRINESVRQDGWEHRESNPTSWSRVKTSAQGSGINVGYPCNYSTDFKDGWRDDKNGSWGWRDDKNESRGCRDDKNGSWGWRDDKNESRGWRDDKNGSREWRDSANESWGWRDNGNDSWGCKIDYHADEPKYSHSKSFWHDARSYRGGYRNTERPLQQTSKYMRTMRHGDAYRDSRQF